MRLLAVLWILAGTLPAPRPAWAKGPLDIAPAIFGTKDDRRSVEDKDVKSEHKDLAKSVAAIFLQEGSASPDAALSVGSYGEVGPVYRWDDGSRSYGLVEGKYKLCEGEDENRFRGLPTGASCTAALIHPLLLLTAAHCVVVEDFCKKARFVFGFTSASKVAQGRLAATGEDVFKCENGLVVYTSSEDWAIIKLESEKPVQGRRPLELAEADPKQGDSVASIGHPAGLPAVVTDAGKVLGAHEGEPFFTSDLDIFQGNSGAPVFSSGGKILGVVSSINAVDYELDDKQNPPCAKLARFRVSDDKNEDPKRMKSYGVVSTKVSHIKTKFDAKGEAAARLLRVEGKNLKEILQAKPAQRPLTPSELARLKAEKAREAEAKSNAVTPDPRGFLERVRGMAAQLGAKAGQAGKSVDGGSTPPVKPPTGDK